MRTHKGQFKPHDPRSGKGGKRPGAGKPTNKEVAKKRAELQGIEMARATVEKELVNKVTKLAERYTKRALQKNADKVLMDAIKKIMPDAKQAMDVTHHGNVTVITNVDPHAGRKKN